MHTFGCTNDVVSFADSELGNGLGCYVGIFIARSLCVVHCLGLTHWFLIAAAPLPLPLPFGLSDTNHRSNIIQYCSFARPCNAMKSRMRTNHLDSKKCERGTQSAENDSRVERKIIIASFLSSFSWFVYCCCAISFPILCDLTKCIGLITTTIREFKLRTQEEGEEQK